jgi:hypothetical protein
MTLQRQKHRAIPLVESLDDRVVLSAASTIGTPAAAAVEIARATNRSTRLLHRFHASVNHLNGQVRELNVWRANLQNAIHSEQLAEARARSGLASDRATPSRPTGGMEPGARTTMTSVGTAPIAFGTTTLPQFPTGFSTTGLSPATSVVTGTTGAGVYSGLDIFGIRTGFETGIDLTDDGASPLF